MGGGDNRRGSRPAEAGGMNERTVPLLPTAPGSERVTGRPSPHVDVRLLRTIDELQRAELLLGEVWGGPAGEPPMALDVMCALSFTGGYVSGAFVDEEMAGVAVGFLTVHGSLHSHIAGVLAPYRSLGVGRAMKKHQRAWAAACGLPSISWTFDPLVRRNAHFNLHRLGAVAEQFLPDFYGPLSDGINQGELTDRLFVSWATDDDATLRDGTEPSPDLELFEPLLDIGAGDEPILRRAASSMLRIATPPDIEAMRLHDRAAADRWRMLMRAALGGALAEGHRIVGFHPSGWYLLEKGARSAD